MTDDIAKLEAALKTGNKEEVEKLLNGLLLRELTSEERGAALFSIGMAYVELMNSADQEYLNRLTAVTEALQAVDARKKALDEVVKIAEVRNALPS